MSGSHEVPAAGIGGICGFIAVVGGIGCHGGEAGCSAMMGVKKQDLFIGAILLAGTVLATLNQTALNPALPSIMESLQVDAAVVQWLVSAYSLVNAIVIPSSAYLMGRFGTRKMFLFALSLFSLGSFLGAVAVNFPMVLVGRILQAVCAGINMPMMFAVLLLIFPREKRGTAMGIVTLAICCAPAIGPTVSGILVDAVGWHGVFWLVFILAVLLLVFAAFKLRPYGEFEKTTFDVPSVAMVGIGLLLLLLGISSVNQPEIVGFAAVGVVVGLVLVVLFARRQFKIETPFLNIKILKTRDFRVAAIVIMFIQATLLGVNVIMPLYIQNTLGFSAFISGLVMLPGAVLGGLGSVLAGRLFDKLGVRRSTVPCYAVMLVSGLGLVLLTDSSSIVLVAVVYAVFLGTLQFANTPMNTWGVNALDNSVIQHSTAITNTLNQVGASISTSGLMMAVSIGSASAVGLAPAQSAFAGQHLAFIALLGMVVVAMLIVLVFVRDRKTEPSDVASFAMETVPRSAGDHAGLLASQVMNGEPYFVRESATVRDAVRVLLEKKTGGIPIVSNDDRVVGFVSDGDIMKYVGSSGKRVLDSTFMLYVAPEDASYSERVAEIMNLNIMDIANKKVVAIDAGMPLETACMLLASNRIKKLPVTSGGKLVGTLSRADIVRGTMADLVTVGE